MQFLNAPLQPNSFHSQKKQKKRKKKLTSDFQSGQDDCSRSGLLMNIQNRKGQKQPA